MTPERHRQIGEIFHAALEVDAEKRASFLDGACAGDEALRREVESLIRSNEEAASFIASPDDFAIQFSEVSALFRDRAATVRPIQSEA